MTVLCFNVDGQPFLSALYPQFFYFFKYAVSQLVRNNINLIFAPFYTVQPFISSYIMKISLLLTAGFYGRLDRRLSILNTPLNPPAPVLGQQPVYFMRLSYRVYQKGKLNFISFLDFPVPKEYD